MFVKKSEMDAKKGFIYLITSVLVTIPFPHFINNITLILLFLYTLVFVIRNKIKPKITLSFILFFGLYFLMALSYIWSINKPLSIIGLERKVVFFLIPFVFMFIPTFSKKERNIIFRLFSFGMISLAFLFLVLGFYHFFKTGSLENLSHHNLVSPLNLNRVYASLFMSIALFHWIVNELKSIVKTVVVLFLSAFILLLSSKTIVITSIAIIVGYIIIKNKKRFNIFKLGSVLLILGVALIFISNKINNKFISELIPDYNKIATETNFGPNYYFNGAELRILYTRFLLEYEKEEDIFFTGFGLNATQEKINNKCLQYNLFEGYGKDYNFHNQYNQTLAEIGFFGLILLLFILYLGFRKALINKDSFAIIVLIFFLIALSTESLFNRQRGIFLFLMVYSLIINFRNNQIQKTK